MSDWNAIKNKIINAALDQPLLASLFIADFAILVFHRPPFIFSILMMGALVGMCLYFGQKLVLFKTTPAPAKAAAAAEPKPVATATADTKSKPAEEAKPAEAKPAKTTAKPKAKAKT